MKFSFSFLLRKIAGLTGLINNLEQAWSKKKSIEDFVKNAQPNIDKGSRHYRYNMDKVRKSIEEMTENKITLDANHQIVDSVTKRPVLKT